MTHVPFLMARAGSADRQGPRDDARARRRSGGLRHDADRHAGPMSSSIATSTTPRSRSSRARSTRSSTRRPRWRRCTKIAPGKRVRGNIEKWASATVSLRGGRIENSAGASRRRQGVVVRRLPAAPDRRRQLQRRRGGATTIRLTSANDARSFTVAGGCSAETLGDSAPRHRRSRRQPDDARAQRAVVRLSRWTPRRSWRRVPTRPGGSAGDGAARMCSPTSASLRDSGRRKRVSAMTDLCFIAASAARRSSNASLVEGRATSARPSFFPTPPSPHCTAADTAFHASSTTGIGAASAASTAPNNWPSGALARVSRCSSVGQLPPSSA